MIESRTLVRATAMVFFIAAIALLVVSGLACFADPPVIGGDDLSAAQDRLQKSNDALESARLAALKTFHLSSKYLTEKADLDMKAAALAKARESGTIQERLDASSAYNLARMEIEKQEKSVEGNDKSVRASVADAEAARANLDIVEKSQQAKDEEKRASEAIETAKQKAAAAEAAIPTVTLSELETVGDRFKGRQIKLLGSRFEAVGAEMLDVIPGVEISSNGLMSEIDTNEQKKWVSIDIRDDTRRFSYVFAKKTDYADALLETQPGQILDIKGHVFELVGLPGKYGIICETISITPVPAAAPNQ